MGIRSFLSKHISEEGLSAYMDGQVTPRERQRIEHHLHECGHCRAELADLRATLTWLHQAPMRPVPRSFTLPTSVQGEQAAYRRWNLAYGALRVAAVAASFALILFLSSDVLITRGVIPIPDRVPASSEPLVRSVRETVVSESQAAPAADVAAPSAAAEPAGAERAVESAPMEPPMAQEVEGTSLPPMPQAMRAPAQEGMGGGEAPMPYEVPPMVESMRGAEGAVEGGAPTGRSVVGAQGEKPEEAQETAPAAAVPAAPAAKEGVAAGPTEPQQDRVAEGEQAAPPSVQELATVAGPTPTPMHVAAHITQSPPLSVGEQEPRPAEPSPMWRVWRTVRMLAGVFLGLLLILAAALIWVGQKRRI